MPFYLIQAVLVTGWWLLMALDPAVGAAFAFDGMAVGAFGLFVIPDLVVIVGSSLVAWRRPGRTVQAILVGAWSYAAAWCIAASWSTRSGYLGTTCMVLALLANGFAVWGHTLFARKPVPRFGSFGLETFLQSAVIWMVFLALLPALLLVEFGRWPVQLEPWSGAAGFLMLGSFSLLGVRSALALVRDGKGTPLPLAAPNRLVVSGPYRRVRNPMAIAGLGQGLGVAVMTRSPEVAAYVVVGMIVWNYLVRPVEEDELRQTFGDDYMNYAKRVRCWIPAFTSPSTPPSGSGH